MTSVATSGKLCETSRAGVGISLATTMLATRRQSLWSTRLLVRSMSTRPGVGHSGHLSADSTLRNRHDGPAIPSEGMTHSQKYLFDLNGFLVLKDVFDADFTARANTAVDAHLHRLHERKGQLRTSGLYGRESKELAGDGETGRKDLGGMLGWDAPHREPFRELLSHPTVAKVLHELIGVGCEHSEGRKEASIGNAPNPVSAAYDQQAASSTHSLRVTHPLPIRISFASTDRLDHSPLMIAQEKGAEGHTLHGGAVTESGEPAWPLAYEFRHGHMRNQLLTVCMQLSDANVGDGGFCVVPGSHKANFAVPPALADLADPNLNEFVRQPAVHPGDVLIFTEAVLHGTLPWTADHQRRTVIYRFAPAGSAYGRGYLPSWPAEALEGMSEAQRCVMAEPYHPRMNRTYVGKDGEAVGAKAREEFKVSFDERVFGSKYF